MFERPDVLSHWFDEMYGKGPLPMRPALHGDVLADVAIVGAGFTGLWTTYYLLKKAPGLKVAIVEARIAGYGASGRSGGAALGQINGSREYWLKRTDRKGLLAMELAVRQAVDDIGQAVKESGIDCSYSKNGVVMVARTDLELSRFSASVEEERKHGIGDHFSRMLSREEVLDRIKIDGAIGAKFDTCCASIQPAKLARGLAETVEKMGATIYEGSPVLRIEPGAAITAEGRVGARYILRATEAYTESVQKRRVFPFHTSMLVTDVIPPNIWQEIRWSGREALLAEHPFLHVQHTVDNRITIGGDDNRIPYLYGSKPTPDAPARQKVADMYHKELVRLFPALRDVKIVGSWQGIFGATRHFAPTITLDKRTGLAAAGGYVGEGIGLSNLAGQTTSDLLLDRDTPLTKLPFVGSQQGDFAPEPIRYVATAIIQWMRLAGDIRELRTGKPSRLVEWGLRLAGFTGRIGA